MACPGLLPATALVSLSLPQPTKIREIQNLAVVTCDNELYTHFIPIPPVFSRSQLIGNALFKPNRTPQDPHGAGS